MYRGLLNKLFVFLCFIVAATGTECICVLQQWDRCVPLTQPMPSVRSWSHTTPCVCILPAPPLFLETGSCYVGQWLVAIAFGYWGGGALTVASLDCVLLKAASLSPEQLQDKLSLLRQHVRDGICPGDPHTGKLHKRMYLIHLAGTILLSLTE